MHDGPMSKLSSKRWNYLDEVHELSFEELVIEFKLITSHIIRWGLLKFGNFDVTLDKPE